jgi:hypothetical protein
MAQDFYHKLVNQFENAQKQNLITKFTHSPIYFSATFSETLNPKSIQSLIQILEYHYHHKILIVVKDPLTIEVWSKGVSF